MTQYRKSAENSGKLQLLSEEIKPERQPKKISENPVKANLKLRTLCGTEMMQHLKMQTL